MTDTAAQTTRFAFQKIGGGIIAATAGQTAAAGSGSGAQMLEVGDYNAILAQLDTNLPSSPVNALSTFTAGTGSALTHLHPWALQKLRLTLTEASIAVTNANKYGSVKILTWPNTNIAVLGARMNLTVTKDGTAITSADAPHIGVGSAAASNTTLATTMIDTIEQTTMAGAAVAEAVQKNGPHSAGLRFITAGATNYLYLNAGTTGNTGAADGTLLASGTIDILFFDMGVYS